MDVKASSARLHAWAVLPNVHLWPNPEWLGIARTQLFITERYSSCHKQGLQGGARTTSLGPCSLGRPERGARFAVDSRAAGTSVPTASHSHGHHPHARTRKGTPRSGGRRAPMDTASHQAEPVLPAKEN